MVSVSLEDALQEVDGVGEAKAAELMEIINEHRAEGVPTREVARVKEMLERGSVNAATSRLDGLLE